MMSTDTIQTPRPVTPHDRKADPFHIGFRYVQQGERWVQVPLTEQDFLFPQPDDRFMSTEAHALAMLYLRHAIEVVHRDRPDVQVFFDHTIDWQVDEYKPMRPDLTVCGNVHVERDPFEGSLPVQDSGVAILMLVEVSSPSTRHVDRDDKIPIFDDLGVPYVLLFDFYAADSTEIVEPRLIALRRGPKGYSVLKANEEFGVWIPTVEMWFKFEGHEVVAFDASKTRIERPAELKAIVDETRVQLEAEKQRAETEKQRAETEKQRADKLEQEIAELRAKLTAQTSPTTGIN
jgi:Putative restriction endonuclease